MLSNKYSRKVLSLSVFFLFVVLFVSEKAFATTTQIQFCTSWKVQYTDSSGASNREDWYTSTSSINAPAQFAEYAVWENNGDGTWTLVDRSWLTTYSSSYGKYCSSVYYLTAGKDYRFRQYTKLQRNNRLIYMVDESASYQAPQRQYVDSDFHIRAAIGVQTKDITPTTMSATISATAVARQYLAVADNIGDTLSSNDQLFVLMDWTNCPDGSQYDRFKSDWMTANLSPTGTPKHAICAPPVTAGSSAIEKFQTGHELGHGLSRIMGGPNNAGGDAEANGVFASGLTDYCTCNQVNGPHCLQSREYIGSAGGESFASFIATALYNARETDAWFGYYKKIYYGPGNISLPTNWMNLGLQTKWMKTKCEPSSGDFGGLGAEWDWTQFYWQLWAHTSTGRFDMADIFTVWQATDQTTLCCTSKSNCFSTTTLMCLLENGTWASFGRLWDSRSAHPSGLSYLVDSVKNEWGLGSSKYLRFTDLGEDTAVNY